MKTAILIVLVLAVAACAASDTESPEMTMPVPGEDVDEMEVTDDTEETDAEEIMDDAMDEESSASEPDVTFVLTGQNFAFFQDGEPNPTLTVNEGDLVRIEFSSTQGFHDWVIDEFDAATTRVFDTDGMVAVEFVADQAGTYEYYCSVGSHRANGMQGNLVVQ